LPSMSGLTDHYNRSYFATEVSSSAKNGEERATFSVQCRMLWPCRVAA
jgi:hypothetical protein